MRELHQTFHDDGLIVIGVHTPEFAHERELENVKAAVKRLGINHPVTIDNDWQTWRAFNNRYWPAQYLIDKRGDIRSLKIGEIHVGDARHEKYKREIEALLAEIVPVTR